MSKATAQELHPDDWQRLRDIRLASLLDSPEAFGADYEVMRNDEALVDGGCYTV